jgi:NitT/TauT family transport system ATP-binding protein
MLALERITMEVKEGEFFVFIGPSGCGKSTLLRIMSGLEKPDSGSFAFSPGIERKDMAFVFQSFALLPWLTVSENIELGLIGRGMPKEERTKIVKRELTTFGLEKFAHAKPHDLSGGMQQRVGIARAFAVDPKILFMDEPFSELDSFTAEELRKELLRIWRDRKTTIIFVTHIIEEAVQLADRIAVLSPRPGRLEKIFVNELPRPRNKRSDLFFKLEDELTLQIR